MRNRFPPATSLKQLEDVLQEEWHKIPLQTVQNLYKSIPRRISSYMVQHHINKEMFTVSVVFPLFFPTPVSTKGHDITSQQAIMVIPLRGSHI
jgi:hypothetical protein